MWTLKGKHKYLRANCKICELLPKICPLQGPKFAQKFRARAKFAKNRDFARKGQIRAKIAPCKIAIFFRDWQANTLSVRQTMQNSDIYLKAVLFTCWCHPVNRSVRIVINQSINQSWIYIAHKRKASNALIVRI